MVEQVYCSKHDCGPYNNDSTQKTEHENKDCEWITYKPENTIKNYENTELIENKLGLVERTNGKKTTTIELLDKPIKSLRPISIHNDKAYILVHLPVRKTTSNGESVDSSYNYEPYFVTSDKELIHPTNEELIEKFQLPIMLNGYSTRWNLEDVKDFCKHSNELDIPEIFHSTIAQVRKFLDLQTDSSYVVYTLWAIGTYFSKLFSYYPYLDFYGTKGSAKSKALNILGLLTYNGEMFNRISSAAIYRIIESSGCTIILDEMEYLKDPKSEQAQTVLSILKGAFQTDGKISVSIATKDQGWQPHSFDAGTCIALGHINGIDDVIEDRTIQIPMQTTLLKAIANNEPDKDNPIWENIRAKYYRLFLEYFKEICELKNKPYDSEIISNRELNQIWKPIITLARFFENHGVPGLITKIEDIIVQTHNRKILINQSSNLDIQILECLVTFFSIDPPLHQVDEKYVNWYKQEEIFNRVKLEEGLGWIQSSRRVGESLDRLNLTRQKVGHFGKCVYIDKEILINLCKRHGLDSSELASKPSFVSPSEQKIDTQSNTKDRNDRKTPKIEAKTNIDGTAIKDEQKNTQDSKPSFVSIGEADP